MKITDILKVRFEDIEWDTEGEDNGEPPDLPTAFDREYPVADFQDCLTYDSATDEYLLDEDAMDEPLGDKLSGEFGWCVGPFRWRLV